MVMRASSHSHAELERLLRSEQREPAPTRAVVNELLQTAAGQRARGVFVTHGLRLAVLRSASLNAIVFVVYVGLAHGY